MGNLFTSLLNSTNALQVYARSLNVVQNNITNVNTPGYVKQDQVLLALPFDPASGLTGGVRAGGLYSYRSAYQELVVRNQQELLGYADQRAADLAGIETLFDLTSQTGIPSALSKFFGAFSELGVNPNNPVSRQGVLDRAAGLAQSFRLAAAGIEQAAAAAQTQTRAVVGAVNRIAARIAEINGQYRNNADAGDDAGLDAQLNAALEELSEYVSFTAIRTEDGAANVYLGGQTILVIGDHAHAIEPDFSTSQTIIRDAGGRDVTTHAAGARLGALVEETNSTLPGYLAELNTLAASLAESINAALAAGVAADGITPGPPLFAYNPLNPAATLTVNPLSSADVAAALPGAPGGNGNAIAIARMGDQPLVNGYTFIQYFGSLGARVGRDVAAARQDRFQFQDGVARARQRRAEQSGVSLDEEAARLLQLQQAYQAAGKLVSVLNELTESVLNFVR